MSLIPNFEKVAAILLSSPVGKAAIAEEKSAEKKDRERIAGRINELEVEGAARAKSIAQARIKHMKEFEEAKAAYEGASKSLAQLTARELADSWRESREREDLEQALAAGCAPEMNVFLDQLRSMLDAARGQISSLPVGLKPTFGRPIEIIASNTRTVREFTEVALEIRAEAQLMCLAADQAAAVARLPEMWHRLMAVRENIKIEQIEVLPPQFVTEKRS